MSGTKITTNTTSLVEVKHLTPCRSFKNCILNLCTSIKTNLQIHFESIVYLHPKRYELVLWRETKATDIKCLFACPPAGNTALVLVQGGRWGVSRGSCFSFSWRSLYLRGAASLWLQQKETEPGQTTARVGNKRLRVRSVRFETFPGRLDPQRSLVAVGPELRLLLFAQAVLVLLVPLPFLLQLPLLLGTHWWEAVSTRRTSETKLLLSLPPQGDAQWWKTRNQNPGRGIIH